MASVAHPVPSRIAQHIAALFGHEDDTLVAWQRFCAQAAEALHAQHTGERLTKALALAQDGAVYLEDDGCATVTSGANHYTVHANGTCDCPDYAKRSAPCKHVLAVLIHVRAQELLAPSANDAAQPPAAATPLPSAPTAWIARDASDTEQLLGATAQGRVLLTFNTHDFPVLVQQSPHHGGLVLAAQQSWTLSQLITALDRLLSETEAADWPGQVRWLNQWRRAQT
jgi:hypothetical protein